MSKDLPRASSKESTRRNSKSVSLPESATTSPGEDSTAVPSSSNSQGASTRQQSKESRRSSKSVSLPESAATSPRESATVDSPEPLGGGGRRASWTEALLDRSDVFGTFGNLTDRKRRASTGDIFGSGVFGGLGDVASQGRRGSLPGRRISQSRISFNAGDSALSSGFFQSRSFSTPDVSAIRKSTKEILEEKNVERTFHRKRRGLGNPDLTTSQVVDHALEHIIATSGQTPWFLRPCADLPMVQRVCFPAEYATRLNRPDEADDAIGNDHGVSHSDEHRRFGFPDFEQAGYMLVPPEQTPWPDVRVATALRLQMAMHRKSSTERLCYTCPKSRLLPATTKEVLTALVKSLKRCDHVNILRCHEVCESEEHLHFLYEAYPCVTLLSCLEDHNFNQRQMVALARECCAAVQYAQSNGLQHLGWSLNHILLPESTIAADADPAVGKIYGFGLQGIVHMDTSNFMCWAPEAVESYSKLGDSFISRSENRAKHKMDNWSLGVLTYSIIARRPPIVGSPEVIKELIISRKWQFTVAFDEVDREAKSLVEGFLNGNPEVRLTAEQALRNEWFRRQSCFSSLKAAKVFMKLEEFAAAPLSKRLFGRFLVRFLDPGHMRKIATIFSELDSNGDGVICNKDLIAAAKTNGRSSAGASKDAQTVSKALSGEGNSSIGLSRFAESMAEEVIDGRALRHAFESLDDDGSEEITPEELFDALSALDSKLTMAEVMQHIEEAEIDVGKGETGKDRKIDFDEFVALFPVRMAMTKTLQARVDSVADRATDLGDRFDAFAQQAKDWMALLKDCLGKVQTLSRTGLDKDNAMAGVKEMKKQFFKISEALRCPPGPNNIEQLTKSSAAAAKRKAAAKKHTGKHSRNSSKEKPIDEEVLGFDSFLQDQAAYHMWPTLIAPELRMIKQSIIVEKDKESVDHLKAHDAASTVLTKVTLVLEWAKGQFEEYQAIVEILRSSLEKPIPHLMYSGRGLRRSGEEEEVDDEEDNHHHHQQNLNPFSRFFSHHCG